jgi:hypothetical protein
MGAAMRGDEGICGSLFSYTDLETRVRADHPLRVIRQIVNAALQALSGALDPLYSPIGRVSIPPEWLMRDLLLQALYSIRSERQLVERLDYGLLFRWFVGLGWRYPSNVARSSAMLNLVFGGGTIFGHKWSVRKARDSAGLAQFCVFPSFARVLLKPRRTAEKALVGVMQEAWIGGVSTHLPKPAPGLTSCGTSPRSALNPLTAENERQAAAGAGY